MQSLAVRLPSAHGLLTISQSGVSRASAQSDHDATDVGLAAEIDLRVVDTIERLRAGEHWADTRVRHPEELDSLEVTLELLSDPEAMRQRGESRHACATGDFVTGDELRGRYPTK